MSKIAVFMSVYNGEHFIEKQLQSIANQKTSCDVRLYIRDDGSTDSIIEIINKWSESLKIELMQAMIHLGRISFAMSIA